MVYLVYGLHRSQGEGQLYNSPLGRTSSEALGPDGNPGEPLGTGSSTQAWHDPAALAGDGTSIRSGRYMELAERTQLLPRHLEQDSIEPSASMALPP